MRPRPCPLCHDCGLVSVCEEVVRQFPDVLTQHGYQRFQDGEAKEMIVICPCCDGWKVLRDGTKTRSPSCVH